MNALVTCDDEHTFELKDAKVLNKNEVLCPTCGKVVTITVSEEGFVHRPVLFTPYSDNET